MTCDFAFRNAIMIYVESIYREIDRLINIALTKKNPI